MAKVCNFVSYFLSYVTGTQNIIHNERWTLNFIVGVQKLHVTMFCSKILHIVSKISVTDIGYKVSFGLVLKSYFNISCQ